MFKRFKILFIFVSIALMAMAQEVSTESLDSIINALELKEVIVTAKKIRQSGDTISYSAATYRGKNDKTLEDLLRKMPGIEVKADGQITYNGQWINEFYIEGLDMLGGNYGVATRNIDANDIGSVQVLQNHQDVKLLQGVKSGNAPAMNIKLKQNALGIWSSTLQAVGFEYYTSTDGEWKYDKMFFSFKPYTNLTFKPSERLSFALTSTCEESMPAALSLMAQRRYIDYRTSISNPYQLEAKINRTIKTALSASYQSVLDMLFGGVTLTHAYSYNSLSNGYDVTDDIIKYIRLPYATSGNIWQGDQTFSKGFFKWNSKISESFTIGSSQNEFYVDDAMHRGRSNYLRANISFTASFARWITFETSNEFSLSKTFTDGIANGNAKHTFTNSTSFVIWPCKQLSLMPTVMYYYNDYSASYRNNTFLNCNIEYSLGNAILSLKCSNLLDCRIFRRYNDNGIIQYSSQYRLRGRTIMLGIRFSIK